MALGREAILSAKDIETREVHVPEWADDSGDDVVLVRGLTGKARADYMASIFQVRGKTTVPAMGNIQAKLVARAIVDEQGNRIFSDQDINALGEKSGAALERVFKVVSEISGLSEEDISEAMGKSETTPNADSISS